MHRFFKRLASFFTLSTLLWGLAMQSGCFAMRTPDGKFARKIAAKGQSERPVFFDVDWDGRKIHAVRIGQDSLPLLAVAHGSPGSADAWLDFLADTVLTRQARIVAFDRPGFGYSGLGRAERSLQKQADALRAVLDACPGGQKPVILVGHSLGGPLIARFAMDFPARTAGLVLVAGSIDPELEPRHWWEAVVDAPPLAWLVPKSLFASNREIHALQGELRAMLPFWAKIKCPVTILHAQNDRLVPVGNTDFAKKILSGCPDLAVRILPDGDHFILWNRHELIRETLLKMCQKVR